MNIAVHAVTPLCPRCDRRVRSSIELQAELVALSVEANRTFSARGRGISSFEAAGDYDVDVSALALRLEELEAELRGEHLLC